MIALAASRTGLDPLLVYVTATDPVRSADLAARVALAGHMVAESEADLVLADATAPAPPDLPVLRMGPGAALPANLSPLQLDAALRAASVGLRVTLPTFDPTPDPRPLLTPRELDILGCLAEGLSNKAAARCLGISAHTVKFHLEAVFTKLGANSRTDAVARGLRGGLIVL